MSIYERAIKAQGLSKIANDNPNLGNQFQGVSGDGGTPLEYYRLILDDPNKTFAEHLKAYMALKRRGENPAPSIQEMAGRGWDAIKSGVNADLAEAHKKFTGLKNDAKGWYNKTMPQLSKSYENAKKSLYDFYKNNEGDINTLGASMAVGGTLGALLSPRRRALGAVTGSILAGGASLGARRVAKYLGYV